MYPSIKTCRSKQESERWCWLYPMVLVVRQARLAERLVEKPFLARIAKRPHQYCPFALTYYLCDCQFYELLSKYSSYSLLFMIWAISVLYRQRKYMADESSTGFVLPRAHQWSTVPISGRVIIVEKAANDVCLTIVRIRKWLKISV